MLSFSDLKPGVTFTKDGQPYVVLEYLHVKKQRGAPIAQLKIKNLITGKNQDITAHQSDKFEEAIVNKKTVEYIYSNKGESWFRDPEDPSKRFNISDEILGQDILFLKEGTQVYAIEFQDEVINIELPPKVELKVVEAPPNIKGNTSDGGNKKVKLETGLEVNTPLFIEAGNVIRISTQTGEYSDRVS